MLAAIKKKVLSGGRLNASDALKLYQTDDIFTLGELAEGVARKHNGNRAYFIQNLHVNPTNVCVNRCRFCAFSRSAGEEGAYEMTIPEIVRRIGEALKTQPVSEVHIVGGLHPDWPFDYYIGIVKSIKSHYPKIHIKAFTATEIDYFSKISGRPIWEVLSFLKSAGLSSMPGGGAEIFSPDVRNALCPEKLSGDGWLGIMRDAHKSGIKTNATMLYGHMETLEQRIEHLIKLRELQDETAGFQAFIPLAYHPKNTDIGGHYSSGLDDLRTIAVSRLVLDNFRHIKAYWVMLGEKISQLALRFGADDLDGTIIEEKITRAAGGLSKKGMTRGQLENLIKKAGKKPVERDSFYRAI